MPPLSFEQKQYNVVEDLSPACITEWYSGKRVLLTGGTGFVGKIIVERFLRNCPDLDCIYMLIRTKKGISPATRFEEYSNEICFKVLRETDPDAFKKLRLIRGDILEEDLGISVTDREELVQNVNVVIHCAATVKFNLPLRDAVEFNVCGTYKVLQLAKEMRTLISFLHVSTAYSQGTNVVLEEKIFPTAFDPLDIMQMCKMLDTELMELLRPKIVPENQSNTYTYTKSLAEFLVSKYASHLPISIARPSVVLCAKSDPMPGFTEYYYGPNGCALAGAHGIMRLMYTKGEYKACYAPVDFVANACIAICWERGLR